MTGCGSRSKVFMCIEEGAYMKDKQSLSAFSQSHTFSRIARGAQARHSVRALQHTASLTGLAAPAGFR